MAGPLYTQEETQLRDQLRRVGAVLADDTKKDPRTPYADAQKQCSEPSSDRRAWGAEQPSLTGSGSGVQGHLGAIAERIYYHEQKAREYKALLKALPEELPVDASRALTYAINSSQRF
jgi:L-cysteine desulfidase